MSDLQFCTNKRHLRAGDWVEVESPDKILASLDEQGCLERLPFMPEMLKYCGQRFRVLKSAHKTCDTIHKTGLRRMENAVHLEGIRCDGEAHGGCQAGCLLFMKEAWLKPVAGPEPNRDVAVSSAETRRSNSDANRRCDQKRLMRATRVTAKDEGSEIEIYRCQATELFRATTPLKWWDPRHYIKDIVSRNVRIREFFYYVLIAAFNVVMRMNWRGQPYPNVRGLARGKTPTEILNLQPGELVRVRSKKEIMKTLNEDQRNRGLYFDVEMLPFCGKTYRVLRRVERIINEKSGVMMRMPNDCIILNDVGCGGCLSRSRLFCPRNIYSFWREIWLKRIDEKSSRTGNVTPELRA
jgi:hypothetical protein